MHVRDSRTLALESLQHGLDHCLLRFVRATPRCEHVVRVLRTGTVYVYPHCVQHEFKTTHRVDNDLHLLLKNLLRADIASMMPIQAAFLVVGDFVPESLFGQGMDPTV